MHIKEAYLDGFVWGSAEEKVLVDTETPDRAPVSHERPLALKYLLRIKGWKTKRFVVFKTLANIITKDNKNINKAQHKRKLSTKSLHNLLIFSDE